VWGVSGIGWRLDRDWRGVVSSLFPYIISRIAESALWTPAAIASLVTRASTHPYLYTHTCTGLASVRVSVRIRVRVRFRVSVRVQVRVRVIVGSGLVLG
jgi:hypothetical protein